MRIRYRPPLMLLLVAGLLTLLVILAVLQYRWLGQVSQAERASMQANLRAGTARFADDFDREITRVYLDFQLESGSTDRQAAACAQRYDNWLKTAPNSRLVKAIFVADAPDNGELNLAAFNPATRRLEVMGWPAAFSALRDNLRIGQQKSTAVTMALDQLTNKVKPLNSNSTIITRTLERFSLPPVEDEIPALIIPNSGAVSDRTDSLPISSGFTIVQLDLDYIKKTYLPELVRRDIFNGNEQDYNVAVTNRRTAGEVICQLGPPVAASGADPDATANILAIRIDDLKGLLEDHLKDLFITTNGLPLNGPLVLPPGKTGHYSFRITNASTDPTSLDGPANGRWQLSIKHAAGSLDAAVASIRRRNLITSFGILLLLGVSMVLIVISSQRAKRLARQQVEFVAGVSHELRTPLAVIHSAGENLADGVIGQPQQVSRYGVLIRNESHRLTTLVEQVLEFAGAQAGRQTYQLRPVLVSEIIEAVYATNKALLIEEGFEVETELWPNLPLVMGDAAALRRALENLITNAMKYCRNNRWIKIAAKTEALHSGKELQISITDRGSGIESRELKHIFEPFYRGREAVSAQIHGTGLGLSLVKHIVEAHGGRITVKSAVGCGSSFTIHLPITAQVMPDKGEVSDQDQSTSLRNKYGPADFAR